MKQYDLIVIGTGGAGYQVAIKTAQAGWKVAAIDRSPFGGTCSVRGCIPKKVLAGTAEVLDINRRLNEIGILTNRPQASWQELIRFKRSFTDPVPDSTKQGLRDAGVDIYEGMPRFTSETELEVNNEQLQGKNIHIAVGLEPARLPIDGFEHLIDSDAFLELDSLPKRILFVGAGYVSFEFAHIAARFGSDVTILHIDSQPLPMFDQDIVDSLLDASRGVGINIELNAGVQRIEKRDNTFVVASSDGRSFEADLVVHGAGRVPSIKDMNLEAAHVKYDKKGIQVNEYLQTSTPHIYAAGDVASTGAPLTPVAEIQGVIVANNLLVGDEESRMHTIPSWRSIASVVFSTPSISRVGYSVDQANEKGFDFDTITTDMTSWFDNKRLGLKYAKSKILIEKNTNKILGAHLIGNHAEEIINIFSLAIELNLTTEQLKSPIFAFPTAGDDMRSMF